VTPTLPIVLPLPFRGCRSTRCEGWFSNENRPKSKIRSPTLRHPPGETWLNLRGSGGIFLGPRRQAPIGVLTRPGRSFFIREE